MSGTQARRLLCHLRRPAWGSGPASPSHRCHHRAHPSQHSRFYVRPRAPLRAPLLARSKDSPPPISYSPSPSTSAVAHAASTLSSRAARRGFVSWYLGMLDARPVLTKSVTAGLIFTAADLSAQTMTLTPSDSFDLIRTSRMAGYGMLISGPSLHLWFNFLSKILPKRDVVNTLKKMLLGQTVYGPIICTVFFSLNAILQGETGAEIFARLKRDLPPALLNGLVYWPMCDFITFRFVPVRLQPLVSNSFSFIWTIYITYMASLEKVSATEVVAA